MVGGIEASLRRLAHYDYWSESVKRSVLMDSTADILLYGNAERAMVELTHRIANGENIRDITDLRGSAFLCREIPAGWSEIDSTQIDQPGRVEKHKNPYITKSQPKDCDDAKDIRIKADKALAEGEANEQSDKEPSRYRLFRIPRPLKPTLVRPISACHPMIR